MAVLTLDDISRLVREGREQAGLTISAWGDNLGIDRPTASHLERSPEIVLSRSWPLIRKIADHFGLNPDEVAIAAGRETRAIQKYLMDPDTRDSRAILIAHVALARNGFRITEN